MSKTKRGDKSKITKNIITAAAIRHVLICPNQAAIILPRGDKSPSLIIIVSKFWPLLNKYVSEVFCLFNEIYILTMAFSLY